MPPTVQTKTVAQPDHGIEGLEPTIHLRFTKIVTLIYFAVDCLLLAASFIATYAFHKGWALDGGIFEELYFKVFALAFFSWVTTILGLRIYKMHRVMKIERVVANTVKAVVVFGFMSIFLTLVVMSKSIPFNAPWDPVMFYGLFFVSVTAWRTVGMYGLRRLRSTGRNHQKIVILGTSQGARELKQFFQSDLSYGYKIKGFFDDNPERVKQNNWIKGGIEEMKQFIVKENIDEVYCVMPDISHEKAQELLIFCEKNLVRFKLVPDFSRYIKKRVNLDFYGNIPIILLRREPLQSLTNRAIKRTFDIFFASMVCLLVYPWLMPIIALWIKLDSKGPVFFKQLRSGKNNDSFPCYKFRTMTVNDKADEQQAVRNDPRITRVGRILRKTNIDEMPQFINVLLGHMSVVGPRPHMLRHTEEYSKLIDKFMVRHLVKPGITGLAQVRGFRGETKEDWQMAKRVQYDVTYLENWTFLFDLKIIALTVINMFKGEKNAF